MGHRISEAEHIQNIRELSEFRNFWKDSPEYPRENIANDRVRYPVDVAYTWCNGQSSIEFSSEFQAFIGSGPDDGTINIDDTAKVCSEYFHLQFKPMFQKYTYNSSDHSLIIADSSTKMGGVYEVRIKPNIMEP